MQDRWATEWHDIEYQGAVAKARPCPESTLRTWLPQQSSSSTREEEGRWVLMEDRRRRNVAFENLAKEMLIYLENSEEFKVGITELQEQLVVLRCSKWLSGRGMKVVKRFVKSFGKKKRSYV